MVRGSPQPVQLTSGRPAAWETLSRLRSHRIEHVRKGIGTSVHRHCGCARSTSAQRTQTNVCGNAGKNGWVDRSDGEQTRASGTRRVGEKLEHTSSATRSSGRGDGCAGEGKSVPNRAAGAPRPKTARSQHSAGLLAHGSVPRPASSQCVSTSDIVQERLAVYSCGGSSGMGVDRSIVTAPDSLLASPRKRARNRSVVIMPAMRRPVNVSVLPPLALGRTASPLVESKKTISC